MENFERPPPLSFFFSNPEEERGDRRGAAFTVRGWYIRTGILALPPVPRPLFGNSLLLKRIYRPESGGRTEKHMLLTVNRLNVGWKKGSWFGSLMVGSNGLAARS